MAYTIWNKDNYSPSQIFEEGNFYYEEDKKIVMGQQDAHTGGLININFRGQEITVFAAKDEEGNMLSKLALPCPPYHHETMREAKPGNKLNDKKVDPPNTDLELV